MFSYNSDVSRWGEKLQVIRKIIRFFVIRNAPYNSIIRELYGNYTKWTSDVALALALALALHRDCTAVVRGSHHCTASLSVTGSGSTGSESRCHCHWHSGCRATASGSLPLAVPVPLAVSASATQAQLALAVLLVVVPPVALRLRLPLCSSCSDVLDRALALHVVGTALA